MTTPTRRTPPKPAAKPAPRRRAPAKPAAAVKAVPAKPVPANSGRARKTAWSIGAVVVAAGAGLAAFLSRGRIAALLSRDEGHVPIDLLYPDRPTAVTEGGQRAIPAFRPDMDAPMTAAERKALKPPPGVKG